MCDTKACISFAANTPVDSIAQPPFGSHTAEVISAAMALSFGFAREEMVKQR